LRLKDRSRRDRLTVTLTREDFMHPYHHALSSQREHGGTAADYQALHNWFAVIWTINPL